MLFAGSRVRSSLENYNAMLQILWREVASGTGLASMPDSTTAYHALIDAIQEEITEPQIVTFAHAASCAAQTDARSTRRRPIQRGAIRRTPRRRPRPAR